MIPKIVVLEERKLVGKKMKMTLASNKTFELWSSFMPKKKEVQHTVSSDMYSMQVYDDDFKMEDFNPTTEFVKWAAVEVASYETQSQEFETYTLPKGTYAVFVHKGPASTFQKTFHEIFNVWLPNSNFKLDKRPHFELLKPGYRPDDPNAEEEVWIPISIKN